MSGRRSVGGIEGRIARFWHATRVYG
jgi:hypothetical protein